MVEPKDLAWLLTTSWPGITLIENRQSPAAAERRATACRIVTSETWGISSSTDF